MKSLHLLLLILYYPSLLIAQSNMSIDGRFEDWAAIPLIVDNSKPDAIPGAVDLLQLGIVDNDEYLHFYLKVDQEILWQVGNRVRFYLDTDDNPNTGEAIGGIGAEVSFTFGERQGQLLLGKDTLPLEYQHLGLVGAPSTTSAHFEWALSWGAQTEEGQVVLPKKPFRFLIVDEVGGDILPDEDGLRYIPTLKPRLPDPEVSFERANSAHLRLLSHNVNRRHFHPDKKDAFTRIYQALAPDLLLLQEAYEGTAEEILKYFQSALPPSRSGEWYAYKAGAEATVLLSPYPAQNVVPLGNSAAYLLQLPGKNNPQLALIALSMPCCRQDSARQAEADQILAFIRDLQKTGGTFDIPKDTPIILAGDANLVGLKSQYHTLVEGSIQDEKTHGKAFLPDWDRTALTDLHPKHFQRPHTYTWRGRGFFPGRLDYVFYTDSVLKIERNFVFDTVGLPKAILEKYNLQEMDAPNTYKHMPLVVDMVLE